MMPDQQAQLKNLKLTGTVVDNADPLHLQRLRIRIDSLHTDVPDNQLPWAVSEMLDGWGNTETAGSFGPPLTGSRVWVYLHNGDAHSPVYTGYVRDKDRIVSHGIVNYPHRVGSASGSGDYFYLDRQLGTVMQHHRTGTQHQIDGSTGRVTNNVAENLIETVAGTTSLNSAGNITMTCPTFHHMSLVHVSQTLTVDQSVNVGANVAVTGNVGCNTLTCATLNAGSISFDGGTY